MNLFHKIFSKKPIQKIEETPSRSSYMPDSNIPIDEKFVLNFKKNYGKFLYCENMSEAQQNFHHIINENKWETENVFISNKELQNLFQVSCVDGNCTQSQFTLSTCESLIAEEGSVMISSNQLGTKKINDLPKNIIIFATTSQIVNNISEGLRNIKRKFSGKIPSNITTLKYFNTEDTDNFLHYGSLPKNMYLLLLEDL